MGMVDGVGKIFTLEHVRGAMHFCGHKTYSDAAEACLRNTFLMKSAERLSILQEFIVRLYNKVIASSMIK
jgi:hypothetical protein